MPETETKEFDTGAVRSKDGDQFDFMSMPLVGLLGVARTAYEGGEKYGRFNYLLGMPAHTCANRAFRHLLMWAAGDRSEPHLEHAAWNCLAASQSAVLNPEINAAHLPGPGFTVTPEMRAHLEAGKAERNEKRKNGLFDKLSDWSLRKLSEVQRLIKQRQPVSTAAPTRDTFAPMSEAEVKEALVKFHRDWELADKPAATRSMDDGLPRGANGL